MRFIFLLLYFVCGTLASNAQFKIKKDWEYDPTDNCFAIKRCFVNVHYSLPLLIKKNWQQFTKNGDYTTNTIGPIGTQIEYAITPKIGITASYSYVNSKASWGQIVFDSIANKYFTYNKGFVFEAHTACIGAQYHLFYNARVDVFSGAYLGYSTYTYSGFSANSQKSIIELPMQHSPFHYMLYFGVRAYVMPKIALFANVGFSELSNVKLGIVYRYGY